MKKVVVMLVMKMMVVSAVRLLVVKLGLRSKEERCEEVSLRGVVRGGEGSSPEDFEPSLHLPPPEQSEPQPPHRH